MISSRFGKSPALAVLGHAVRGGGNDALHRVAAPVGDAELADHLGRGGWRSATAFWIAAGLALFATLFGTRNLDANERHHGVVAAIADRGDREARRAHRGRACSRSGASPAGSGEVFADAPPHLIDGGEIFGPRWTTMMLLSAAAIICLPRQFQVTVVENVDERHLATASWAFPLYLFGMSLFVMPIAAVGWRRCPRAPTPISSC